ncbi:TPA: hypothetical protein U9M35_002887 [Acinetobacter baumannii]|nr:hypothetical protein [Acinetobacter baumannii]
MPFWMQQLLNGGLLQEEADGEGGDLGAGAGDQGQGEQPGEGAGEQGKAKEGDGEQAAEKPKPTDAEAKLLKELMKRKESEKAAKAELENLKASLNGLDLEEARQLLAAKKEAEEKALEAKGDYERIKQRMAEEHQKEVDALKAQIAELTGAKTASEQRIADLTVGTQFSQSQFIQEELVLPPTKARALYGQYFEIEDGQVVGYDQPRGAANRTALVNAYGQPLPFDEAMRKIIEADPEKDHLIRAKAKQGAGSNSAPKGAPLNTPPKQLSGQEKIHAGLGALLNKKS